MRMAITSGLAALAVCALLAGAASAAEKKEAADSQKKRKVPTLRRPGEQAPPQ